MFATLQERKICFGDFVDYLMKNELMNLLSCFHFLLGLFMHCGSYVCSVQQDFFECHHKNLHQQSVLSGSIFFYKMYFFYPHSQICIFVSFQNQALILHIVNQVCLVRFFLQNVFFLFTFTNLHFRFISESSTYPSHRRSGLSMLIFFLQNVFFS